MSEGQTLEERVAVLERELIELKQRIGDDRDRPKKSWIDQVSGSFADDPEFDEVVRLGREFRMAYSPDLDSNESDEEQAGP